jgi:hypothetical protein
VYASIASPDDMSNVVANHSVREYWILNRKVYGDRPWSCGVECLELYQNIASCDSPVSIILRSQERSRRGSRFSHRGRLRKRLPSLETLNNTASLNLRMRLPIYTFRFTCSTCKIPRRLPCSQNSPPHAARFAAMRNAPGSRCSLTSGRNTFG